MASQNSFNKIYTSATLPVDFGNSAFLDSVKAKQFGESFAGQYCLATPYPHIVIDNFLPCAMADNLLANFPTTHINADVNFKGEIFQHNKRAILPYHCNESVRNIFLFFNSAPFIQFLESMTKIKSLISDPYFSGGGFHEISTGGKLGIHADFRIHPHLHLNRRINILIYLNKNWEKQYGGNLEVWNQDMTVMADSIEPLFNRCVIFNTDANSYHGHPDPLNTPDGITRKSIALYYYTASQAIYWETPNYTTMFKARPSDEEAIKVAAENQNNSPLHKNVRVNVQQWLPPIFYKWLKKIKNHFDFIVKRK